MKCFSEPEMFFLKLKCVLKLKCFLKLKCVLKLKSFLIFRKVFCISDKFSVFQKNFLIFRKVFWFSDKFSVFQKLLYRHFSFQIVLAQMATFFKCSQCQTKRDIVLKLWGWVDLRSGRGLGYIRKFYDVIMTSLWRHQILKSRVRAEAVKSKIK